MDFSITAKPNWFFIITNNLTAGKISCAESNWKFFGLCIDFFNVKFSNEGHFKIKNRPVWNWSDVFVKEAGVRIRHGHGWLIFTIIIIKLVALYLQNIIFDNKLSAGQISKFEIYRVILLQIFNFAQGGKIIRNFQAILVQIWKGILLQQKPFFPQFLLSFLFFNSLIFQFFNFCCVFLVKNVSALGDQLIRHFFQIFVCFAKIRVDIFEMDGFL